MEKKYCFGSEEKYKMLAFIHEKVALLDIHKQRYITKFFSDFNERCNELTFIINKVEGDNIHSIDYLLRLVEIDYRSKVNQFIPEELISRTENYIHAKLGDIKVNKSKDLYFYTFWYNDGRDDKGIPVSIHKTNDGALNALTKHKKKIFSKREEKYAFGKECWIVIKTKVKN